MNKITSAALFFLAAGILTSVSILSVYQILFAVPLIYYTFLSVKNKEIQLPKSAYWLLAFTVIALISLVLNFELIPKPSKNFGRLKYFFFGIGGIFVMRAWLQDASDKTKKILTQVFLSSIIIAALATLISFFRGDARAKGLTDTMRYGYGSGMLLLTVLSAILHKEKIKNWFPSKLAIVSFIIGFAGLYITYTRGALLAFLCGLPFVLYYYKKRYGIYAVSLVGLIVLTLGGFYIFGNVQKGQGSRFLMSKSNNSDVVRRSQWKAAAIAIQERPVLGWGLSNFHSQLKRIKIDYDLEAKDYNDAHAHNLFLEIGAGTGLVGLFLFLGWLISWAYECFKKNDLTTYLVVPFGVALVIASQFEVTFDANNASMIFFLYSISSQRKVHV